MNQKRLFIDYTRLRAALPFGTVLSHYHIPYPDGRQQVKVRCPFHTDQDPSLSISLAEGKFQCFGCGKKGNALEFVAYMEELDPEDKEDLYQTAQRAIALLGQIPESFRKESSSAKPPQSPRTAKKGAKRPESRVLPQTARGGDPTAPQAPSSSPVNPVLDLELKLEPDHSFLTDRGITSDIATQFGLGYCSGGMMKNRIAIPIHNADGQLVAYAGRYADAEIPEGVERYKLPKNFHKSLVLYNLHRARTLGKRHVVVVEGYWSAIRLQREGIPTVALMGHSCSPEQASLLRPAGFKFVTLLLDGDEAGRQATPGVLAVLASQLYVRFLSLPEGVKPDTMPAEWFDHLR